MVSVMGYLAWHLRQSSEPFTISCEFSSLTVNSSFPLHTGQTRMSSNSLFIVSRITSFDWFNQSRARW